MIGSFVKLEPIKEGLPFTLRFQVRLFEFRGCSCFDIIFSHKPKHDLHKITVGYFQTIHYFN